MLACVYPAESFKSKAVTVKLRHGRSKRKPKLLSVKEKPADGGKQPECDDTPKLENEVSSPFLLPFPCSPSITDTAANSSPSLYRSVSSPSVSLCLLRVNFYPEGGGIQDRINSKVYIYGSELSSMLNSDPSSFVN